MGSDVPALPRLNAPRRGEPLERSVRTFESATRHTLDIFAMPLLERETPLPVLVDPGHAAGRADLVYPLSMAAVAAGADGLLIDVHPDPSSALSDGPQSLNHAECAVLMKSIEPLARLCERSLATCQVARSPVLPHELSAQRQGLMAVV